MSKKSPRGVTSGIGVPMRMQGRNGDITIRKTRDGKILYIKEDNQWHPINTGIDIAQLRKDVDRLSDSVRRNNSGMPPRPVFSRIKLTKAVGTAEGEAGYDKSSKLYKINTQGLVVNAADIAESVSYLAIASKAGYNAYIQLFDGTTHKWAFGYDQGDAGEFKIKSGSFLEGEERVALTTSGNLTATGTVTSGGFTTTGTWTFDTSAGGTTGITAVNAAGTFTNDDATLMTAAAIEDKITGYGYSTTAGDITGVTAGDGLSGGGTSGTVSLAISVDDSTIETDSDAIRVKDDGITYAKIQNVTATDRILGRDSSGAGVIEEITPANLRTMINVADGATAVTNHITNDKSDTMTASNFGANAALKIVAFQPATTEAENSTGLHIDYDREVATDETNAHNDIGIDLDVNAATLGTGSVKGMDIDVVGATSGTHTAVGIDLDVDSADTNIGMIINTAGTHMKLVANADADDYATFTLADTGDLTIETVGDGADDSDITLDADGAVILDSSSGFFQAKKAGTEFSAANSAYAGMILGYTRLQGDLTNSNSFEIQNSMTVEDSTHQITFTTPPSENVEIEVSCLINVSSTDTEINIGVSDNSTYNSIGAQFEYDGAGVIFSDDESDDHIVVAKFILGASELAAIGSSNTFYIGFSTAGATKTANINYGVRASHGIGDHPFVIKATALPLTIYDGL
jgi:hypothetical protein